LSGCRTATFPAPMKHLHAVGHFVAGDGMHRLAVARAAQMSEASSRDHAAGRLFGMIDRRQHSPFRSPGVHSIVAQALCGQPHLRCIAELGSCPQRAGCKFIDGSASIEDAQMRFFYERHAPHGAFLKLNEPHYQICFAPLFDNFEISQIRIIDGQAEAGHIVGQIDESLFRCWLSGEQIPEQFIADFNIHHREVFCHR